MNTVEELFHGFQQLNDIGAALSSERDINRLLENILVAAKSITRADAGTLYFMDENRENLRFAIVINDSQKLMFGGTSPLIARSIRSRSIFRTPTKSTVSIFPIRVAMTRRAATVHSRSSPSR
jgi:transcriptional regulator with GAF, ATPase, and Fis domain